MITWTCGHCRCEFLSWWNEPKSMTLWTRNSRAFHAANCNWSVGDPPLKTPTVDFISRYYILNSISIMICLSCHFQNLYHLFRCLQRYRIRPRPEIRQSLFSDERELIRPNIHLRQTLRHP